MSNETETVKAEYEAYWDCPKCGGLTTQNDDEHIDYDSEDSLSITCAHNVDEGGDYFVPCGHCYSVDLW